MELEVSGSSQENRFVPIISDDSVTSENTLEEHSAVSSSNRPHICDICHKDFGRKGILNKHKLIHSGEKPFTCSLCHKSFNQNHDLKRHFFVHSGQKPFECEVCHKCFRRKEHLKAHNLTHSGEKPHVCSICQKSFAHKHTIKNHLLVHSGEKPHVCNICNKGFVEKVNLSRHYRIHGGDGAFLCSICDKAFPKQEYLRKLQFSFAADETVNACESCYKEVSFKGRFEKFAIKDKRRECLSLDEIKTEAVNSSPSAGENSHTVYVIDNNVVKEEIADDIVEEHDVDIEGVDNDALVSNYCLKDEQ